jgi:hypothetical protein
MKDKKVKQPEDKHATKVKRKTKLIKKDDVRSSIRPKNLPKGFEPVQTLSR